MRRSKFCPKCGKDTQDLHSGLCGDCFLEKLNLSDKIPKKISVGTCKMCGKVFIKEGRFDDSDVAIENLLEHTLRQKEIAFANYRVDGQTMFLTVRLDVEGLEKTFELQIPVVRKAITCNMCSLQKASYFNVTIQVRAPKGVEERIVSDIHEELRRINKRDVHSFVSGVTKLKEGTDILVGSKSAANKVVRIMRDKYGASLKKSRKLYGLIEGKKSYRDTILVSVSK